MTNDKFAVFVIETHPLGITFGSRRKNFVKRNGMMQRGISTMTYEHAIIARDMANCIIYMHYKHIEAIIVKV